MPQSPKFTTDAWQSLRHEWLWVYRGPVPVVGVWSAEIPVPTGVFFVEHGEGRIHAGGGEFVVTRGDAFFSAPGPRRHWFAKGTRLLSVGLRSQWPDGRPLFRDGLNFSLKSPQLRLATEELFRRVYPRRKEVTYRQATSPQVLPLKTWATREAAFQTWFELWCRVLHKQGVEPQAPFASRGRGGRADRLVAWLESRPLDQTTPSVPPNFGLGLRRADQLLQQQLGLSLRGYLEQRRLSAARERVLADDATLKEIAFELGFRHASHFTAWFRRQVGVSPSVYRQGGTEAV